MANEPLWLTAEQIVEFNEYIVTESGEPHLVQDRGLLESAVARPQNHWSYGETDTVILAVALLLGIARNHPFQQGNKRTAFAAADSFLYLNGYELNVPDRADLADLIISVITGDAGEHILVEVFAHHIEPCE